MKTGFNTQNPHLFVPLAAPSLPPIMAAPVESSPGRGPVDWAIGQILDSSPFVFSWKSVKVQLKADC